VALAVVLATSAAVAEPAARAAPCPAPVPYPGDSASREAIAGWMADRARSRGIPAELPVMAALEESGLRNLSDGGSDTAGFFQMRLSIWNQGAYAGYPDNPELQIDWFLDLAEQVRQQRVAAGLGLDEQHYGEWIADVERPPEQDRGRYQPRLGEARDLIGPNPPPCGDSPSPPPPDPEPDVTPPALRLGGALVQPALARRALLVKAACGVDPCSVAARGTIKVAVARGSAARVFRIAAGPVALGAGQTTVLRLRLGARLRRAARRALARGVRVRARITVTATDPSGNAATGWRQIRLRR
jgi:hypothetical protein